MEIRPQKLRIIVGKPSDLDIPSSLALKCHNLSLGDPNEMIQIHNKPRLIEIYIFLKEA